MGFTKMINSVSLNLLLIKKWKKMKKTLIILSVILYGGCFEAFATKRGRDNSHGSVEISREAKRRKIEHKKKIGGDGQPLQSTIKEGFIDVINNIADGSYKLKKIKKIRYEDAVNKANNTGFYDTFTKDAVPKLNTIEKTYGDPQKDDSSVDNLIKKMKFRITEFRHKKNSRGDIINTHLISEYIAYRLITIFERKLETLNNKNDRNTSEIKKILNQIKDIYYQVGQSILHRFMVYIKNTNFSAEAFSNYFKYKMTYLYYLKQKEDISHKKLDKEKANVLNQVIAHFVIYHKFIRNNLIPNGHERYLIKLLAAQIQNQTNGEKFKAKLIKFLRSNLSAKNITEDNVDEIAKWYNQVVDKAKEEIKKGGLSTYNLRPEEIKDVKSAI